MSQKGKYIQRVCCSCGKEYFAHANKLNSKYCSRRCSGKANNRKPQIQARICPICSTEFQPKQSKIIYCSIQCKNESQRIEKEFTCAYCGKVFYRKPSDARKNKTGNFFCDNDCRIKWWRGERHNWWKSGFHFRLGYKVVLQKHHKYKFEHRLIMEEHIGRKLSRDEVIHHINGNRLDNRIENLVIMTNEEHGRLHNPPKRKKCNGGQK